MTDTSDEWVQRLHDDSAARLEAIARMQDELAEVHGEATAARGLVSVRVTPAGMPTRLHLQPGATRLPADQLAGEILAAIGDAAAQAAERVRAVVGRVVARDDLDAMLGGTVAGRDRDDVRAQLDAMRGPPGATPARGSGSSGAS